MTSRSEQAAAREPIFGPAHADDVAAIVAIDESSPPSWTADAFIAELKHDPPTLFALRSSGQVVGFVVARGQTEEMDIVNLNMAVGYRRRGLGRFLLRSLLDRAAHSGVRVAFLEVREGNQGARALYASCGFMETQRRRGFYNEPVEDAILMRLEIDSETRLKGLGNAC